MPNVPWKDSNLALIGTELDHKIKQAAALEEDAWTGMGEQPETRIWRIEQFQIKAWPVELYGKFHKGDSYIVLHTRQESNALLHDVHIWIGAESSQDEYGTAAYKMVEADEYLGGVPVQHRQVQGHESTKFRSYFDSIEYLDGGIASGFHHVEPTLERPFLFRVKGTHRKMTLTQVPLRMTALNAGDSFILYATKAVVWCWHGAQAKPMEKAQCNAWAETLCTLGTVTVLDQGDGDDEYPDFWNHLEKDGEIGPDMDDDEEVTEFVPVLYRVDGDQSLQEVAKGTMVQKTSKKVACLQRSAMDKDDVFLLDSGWEIFVWVGEGSDHSEKLAAMAAADRYAVMEPRALELPVTIVKDGHESQLFLSYFE